MRILDVSPRTAYPPAQGSVVRTYNLLRRLSRNHEVRQFCQNRWRGLRHRRWIEEVWLGPAYCAYQYYHPVASAISELAERCWVRAPVLSGGGLSLSRPGLLRQLLSWADVALVEFPWQFEYCRRIKPDGRFVLDCHNVEVRKFHSYAEAQGVSVKDNGWLRHIEKIERKAVNLADRILAVSAADRQEFINSYDADPSRVVEVPNGADTEMYLPADRCTKEDTKRALGLPDKPTVIFVGSNVPPNHAGLRWVESLARQAPRFTFLVVGSLFPGPQVQGNLMATGYVEDYRPHQRAADIAICPIRYGGGTKIKLLESLAAALPTVAFAATLQGTRLRANEHLLIAEENETALLEALHRLADDRDLAERLGAAGRRHVLAHHDWANITKTLEAALLQLV